MALSMMGAVGLPALTMRPRASRVQLRSSRVATRSPLIVASMPDGKDKEPEQTWASKVTGPFAATLAAALMLSASLPEDAMAARSGGRVGGSSFSARRAAPPPRAAPRASPRVNSSTTNVYVAPPVVGSPFGFGGGFGFHPFGFGYGYGYPVMGFGFGGVLNLFVLMFVLTTVLNIVSSIKSSDNKKTDNWDDDDF